MTIPESPDNVVLALALPRVLGATHSIIGAILGISLVIYDLVIDGKGATVEVDPPLPGTVDPGDVLQLWLIGESTFLDSQIIQDENAITTLRIPKGRLHPDQINGLYYIFMRGSSNIGTSQTLTMLYNKVRPGLKDTKPEVDGHSELELRLPEAIKNGVDADFVSAQLCVSYPYCRAYDRISLKCNGELMTYQVRADEAPQPPHPGSPIPTTVCFTVTRAYLESAQRPGQTLDFSYTVTDQLGNTPDTDAVWSGSQTVDEDLAGTRLPAPIVREKENDPTDEPGIIDLEKLGSNPLLVIILTADTRFQPGDTVSITYTAKIEGQPDVVVTASGVVEADEFGQKKPCILQVPNDKAIADSRVTVTYQLLRSGASIGSSRAAIAQVTGEAAPEFDAPTIREAEPDGTTLQPLKAKDTLTAVIPAADTRPSDLLSVQWIGAPGTAAGGSHTTVPRPISEIGLSIALLVSVLAYNLAKTVTVTFTITRNGRSFTSKPLTLNVRTLPVSALNSPLIEDADVNNVLDVAALGGKNVMIRALSWALIAEGQQVWMTLEGKKADGSTHNLTVWVGGAHYVNATWFSQGYWPRSVANNYFTALGDGSSLRIKFSAALDQSNKVENAVVFADRVYTIKAFEVVTPTITQAEDSKGVAIPQGGTTNDTTVKLTGTASKEQSVKILDGTTDKGDAIADPATGVWTKTLTGLSVAEHSFKAKALDGSGQTSAARTLTVTAITLQKPWIKENSAGNALNPILVKDVLTIVVPANSELRPTDDISVTWEGAAGTPVGGSHTSTPRPVSAGLEFAIPNSVVAFNLNKNVKVSYIVIRGARPIPSPVFDLAVLAIPQNELPMPVIKDADNNGEGPELNVGKLTTNATYRMGVWPLIAIGQYVWLSLRGTKEDGSDYVRVIHQPPGSQVGEGWITDGYYERAIALSDLKSLKDGSSLTMEFKAAFGKSTVESEAVVFPVRTYTVKAFVEVRPAITQAEDSEGAEIPQGGTTTDTSITLIGTASKGQSVKILDGTTDKGDAVADLATGIWTIILTGLSVAAHSFTAKALYGSNPTSAARTFTIALPLTIDTSLMRLDGFSVKIPDWPKTGQDSIGNTASRQPQGGKPTYSYRSDNTRVASVTQQGKVTGLSNGVATIFVTDQLQNEVSYSVHVTNTWKLLVSPLYGVHYYAISWINSVNGTNIEHRSGVPNSFIDDVNRVYVPPIGEYVVWIGHWHAADPNYGYCVNKTSPLSIGAEHFSYMRPVWCLTPNVV